LSDFINRFVYFRHAGWDNFVVVTGFVQYPVGEQHQRRHEYAKRYEGGGYDFVFNVSHGIGI